MDRGMLPGPGHMLRRAHSTDDPVWLRPEASRGAMGLKENSEGKVDSKCQSY